MFSTNVLDSDYNLFLLDSFDMIETRERNYENRKRRKK